MEPIVESQKKKIDDDDEDEEPKGPSGFSKILNRYFHHLDRGGSLGGEIGAGIMVFLLAMALLFLNMQILGNAINGTIEIGTSPKDEASIAYSLEYVGIYEASILVAFFGSLAIGLIARLPFVSLSVMGLGTAFISLVGTTSGLTYQNLLFLDFIASILYAILVSVPLLRRFLSKAMPNSLRKALPGAVGLLLAFVALECSGLIQVKGTSLGNEGTLGFLYVGGVNTSLTGISALAFVMGMIAIACYFIFRRLDAKHPFAWSFLIGTLGFFAIGYLKFGGDYTNPDSVVNFGRVWLIAGSSKEVSTPFADSYLTYMKDGLAKVFGSFGDVFSKGANFSAYKGNVLTLVISATLSYLLLGLYNGTVVEEAAAVDLNRTALPEGKLAFDEAGTRKLDYCNAALNVIAPFLGLGAIVTSSVSLVGTKDRGKSGLVSVVASLGFLISLFIWAVPALLATSVYPVTSMNQWNYFAYGNGGFLYLVQGVNFGIADAMLAALGISMAVSSFQAIDWSKGIDAMASAVLILASVLTGNWVVGVSFALLCYTLGTLLSVKQADGLGLFASFKAHFVSQAMSIGVPTYVLSGICLLLLICL